MLTKTTIYSLRISSLIMVVSALPACAAEDSGGSANILLPSGFGTSVEATVETEPVPHDGDAADDPAIWVHPIEASSSTIIGTDKLGGLAVYDLSGEQIQYLPDGNFNNVDLQDEFSLNDESVTIVVASDQLSKDIVVYRVVFETRELSRVGSIEVGVGLPYGLCMYRNAETDRRFVFVNNREGDVEQWELFDDQGSVSARMVRAFSVGGKTEGCVADNELAVLFIGEEERGIWKYEAEPDASGERQLVDTTGPDGHLTADVEGLTLYYGKNNAGYLIASSQGSDQFVVYDRGGRNEYLATFHIVANDDIDGVSHTDGIDVTHASLGEQFPQGVFVAQDGNNDGGNQNFKLVSWRDILGSR